jgi:hypothetical protein
VIRPCVLALAVLAGAVPASAQPAIQFIPRYDFSVGAEYLAHDDPRFIWDADFFGEIDAVDYGFGRFTFWANYEVVMGEELRAFDPNQGNYILAGSLSARAAGFEMAGVFYHQSRHLSDRPKMPAVAWNMMGGRVTRVFRTGRAEWQARADLRGTIEHAYVDYRWELEPGVQGRIEVRPGVAVVSAVRARVLGVDGTRDRGTQTGFVAEAGVRFEGRAGAIELYAGAERRIDPYPLDFGTATWARAGFRLLSR